MIHWHEGIEAEVRAARRNREEAVERVRRAKKLFTYFRISATFVSVSTIWNLATVSFFQSLPAFVMFVIGVALLTWMVRIHGQARTTLLAAEELLEHRQKIWDDVCARLARGES